VKFGLILPNFSAWFTPENIRSTLSLAEELGYDSVWANDHVVFPGNLAAHYGNQFLDPLALLPYMAACSTNLILATSILVIPYRPPIPTAKTLASIDRLSGGRLLVGVGVGHEPEESEVLGLPYNQRGRMTDEYLRIMIELWTKEDASFKGKYYSFQDVKPLMPPVQRPYPPLTIGGSSDAAFKRIVEFGAGWHPSGRSAESLQPGVEKLREVCAEHSMSLPEITVRWSPHVAREEETSGEVSPTSVGETRRLQWSAQQIRDEVAAFEALGVARLALGLPPNRGMFLEQMSLFAKAAMS
jgi:probable F420-dependent oxidoreductase